MGALEDVAAGLLAQDEAVVAVLDEDAEFHAATEPFRREILAHCYRIMGSHHDAEDLTQEVFIRAFKSIHKFEPGTLNGWLHRITTNLFLDMVRRRNKIRMEALPEDYERVPGTDMTPEQAYTVANLDPALQSALDGLAPDFRVAVVLCDVVGMSYDEIAETLGVKMGTVRSRIHRGRSQLRAALEKEAQTNAEARILLRTR